jgi:hypothetical protein
MTGHDHVWQTVTPTPSPNDCYQKCVCGATRRGPDQKVFEPRGESMNTTDRWKELQASTHEAIDTINEMEESGQAAIPIRSGDGAVYVPVRVGIEDGTVYISGLLLAFPEDSKWGRYFIGQIE